MRQSKEMELHTGLSIVFSTALMLYGNKCKCVRFRKNRFCCGMARVTGNFNKNVDTHVPRTCSPFRQIKKK